MKRLLFGLAVALITFLCGILIVEIIRNERKTIPKPLFEKEVVDVPLFEIAPISETENVEVEEKSENQIFSGWYEFNDYKNMPDVNMIFLGRDYDYTADFTRTENISPNGGVFTDYENYSDQGFVENAWTKIDGNKVSFKTKKIKGIIFQFQGTFYKNKTMGEEGEKLLRGALRKFVQGKKVAEASGDFAYYEPHCWH